MARAAAELWRDAAEASVRERGLFVVALSGGSTPALLYRLLGQRPLAESLPWGSTHLFWSDERWVPMVHPESNARLPLEGFLGSVPVPPEHIHPIHTLGTVPATAAMLAEHELRALMPGDQTPRFDLALLGLGDDGHTASLFPGTQALGERQALFTANGAPNTSAWRVTATVTLLNASRHIAFLVTGSGKAQALRQVLKPQSDSIVLPASMVRPSDGELSWLVDEEAGALLSEGER